MPLTASEVILARAPQYSGHARLSSILTYAAQITSSSAFGDNYGLAVGLRALHMLDLESQRKGTAVNSGITISGAIASKSEGELSESYTNAMQKRYGDKYPDLCQTGYGIELIALIESNIVPILTQIPTTIV